MPYIGQAPAPKVITSSDLSADVITEAKIADNAVENEHLNANVITGHTALGATPADTDELLVSDAGTLKRVDFSYLKGGGAFEKLVTTTISTSTSSVEFNNTYLTSTYRDYRVIITGLEPSADNQQLALQISSNNGSSFDTSSNYNQNAFGGRSSQSTSDSPTGRNFQDGDKFLIAGKNESNGSGTGEHSHYHIDFFDPLNQNSDNQFFTVMWSCLILDNDSKVVRGVGAGVFDDAGSESKVVNAIKLFMGSGTIDKGSFTLYGRKI